MKRIKKEKNLLIDDLNWRYEAIGVRNPGGVMIHVKNSADVLKMIHAMRPCQSPPLSGVLHAACARASAG